MVIDKLEQTTKRNCQLSDARHCGIYSLCTMVLKLRNLFKWENGMEPWEEPPSPELLDWIDDRENLWEDLVGHCFQEVKIDKRTVDPFDVASINEALDGSGLVYGAGYGRSLKEVFFLAEVLEKKGVEGFEVIITDREISRELAAPIGLRQEGTIYIRRHPMRFYFWDQIQEARPSGKAALRSALADHGLLTPAGMVDAGRLRDKLDTIVDQQIDTLIYHEVGEGQDSPLDSELFRTIISSFADSPVELLVRGVKDVLADTHPRGLLGYIIRSRNGSSLGFYVAFLDGLRKILMPEIVMAHKQFLRDHDWQAIERGRQLCRQQNVIRASKLREMSRGLERESMEAVMTGIQQELLEPLGLGGGRS